MNLKERNRRLRQILNEGDPAADYRIDPEKTILMRRRIRQGLDGNNAERLRWPILWTAASAAVVLAVVMVWRDSPATLPEGSGLPPAAAVAAADRSAASDAGAVRQAREIHFVTEGGTRVIWTLDPDFDL